MTFNIQLGYDSGLVIMWYSIDLLDKIYFWLCSRATGLCLQRCEGFNVLFRMGDDFTQGLDPGSLGWRAVDMFNKLDVASLARKKAKIFKAFFNIYEDCLLGVLRKWKRSTDGSIIISGLISSRQVVQKGRRRDLWLLFGFIALCVFLNLASGTWSLYTRGQSCLKLHPYKVQWSKCLRGAPLFLQDVKAQREAVSPNMMLSYTWCNPRCTQERTPRTLCSTCSNSP